MHRTRERDVESGQTVSPAHVRGLFFDGKCSPHMCEVPLTKNNESALQCGARFLR